MEYQEVKPIMHAHTKYINSENLISPICAFVYNRMVTQTPICNRLIFKVKNMDNVDDVVEYMIKEYGRKNTK